MRSERINWVFFLLIEVALWFVEYQNNLYFPAGVFISFVIMGMNPLMPFLFQSFVFLTVTVVLKLVYKASKYRKTIYFTAIVAALLILYFPFHVSEHPSIKNVPARRYIGTAETFEAFERRNNTSLLLYLLSVSVFITFAFLNIPDSRKALQSKSLSADD